MDGKERRRGPRRRCSHRTGEWTFSVQARAAQIHRWDLSERSDNPAANVNLEGGWNTGMRSISAERLLVQTSKSNLRVARALLPMQHLLGKFAWIRRNPSGGPAGLYRAFDPHVNTGIVAEQYFTGAAVLRGWPLEIGEAAFSAREEKSASRFDASLRIGAVQGGRQRTSLIIAPVRVSYVASERGGSGAPPIGTTTKRRVAGENKSVVSISLTHDFSQTGGSVSIDAGRKRWKTLLK